MRKTLVLLVCMAFLSGHAAVAALTDNGDGTVTDTPTGLMWQKATAPGIYTWQAALAYCENLTLAGYSDWRLPSRNELQSLVDYSRFGPAIDPLLASHTVSSYYWSSTTSASYTHGAWLVGFSGGDVGDDDKALSYYVRAVRSGQPGSFGRLVISKSGGGAGTVFSLPAGINCGNQCSASFSLGAQVELTAQSVDSSTFAGWSGCDSVSPPHCTVSLTGDRTIRAYFELNNDNLIQENWINIIDTDGVGTQLKLVSLLYHDNLNRYLYFSPENPPGNEYDVIKAIYARDALNNLMPRYFVLDRAYLAQSAKKFVDARLKDSLSDGIKSTHIVYNRKTPSFNTPYDAWTPVPFGEEKRRE